MSARDLRSGLMHYFGVNFAEGSLGSPQVVEPLLLGIMTTLTGITPEKINANAEGLAASRGREQHIAFLNRMLTVSIMRQMFRMTSGRPSASHSSSSSSLVNSPNMTAYGASGRKTSGRLADSDDFGLGDLNHPNPARIRRFLESAVKFAQATEDTATSIQKSRDEGRSMEDAVLVLEQRCGDLELEKAQIEDLVRADRDRAAEVRANTSQVMISIDAKRRETEALLSECEENQNSLRHSQQKLEQIGVEKKTVHEECIRRERCIVKDREATIEAVNTLRRKYESCSSKLAQMQDDIRRTNTRSDWLKEYDSVYKEYTNIVADIIKMRNYLRHLVTETRARTEHCKQSRTETNGLAHALAAKTQIHGQLEKKLADAKAECKRMEQEMEEMKVKLKKDYENALQESTSTKAFVDKQRGLRDQYVQADALLMQSLADEIERIREADLQSKRRCEECMQFVSDCMNVSAFVRGLDPENSV